MFKRIVVPVDFSAASLRALDYAVELGRPRKAELIVVHAVERFYYAGAVDTYAPVYDATTLTQQFAQAAREQLARIAKQLQRKHLEVRTVLEIGAASDVVTETARKLHADLIVLSTHGRTGLAHVLMGSVAEKIVRHASCAVLIVRGMKAKKRSTAKRRVTRAPRPTRAVRSKKAR